MNLEKHIAALLYHHDCVVIPDFGAFVARKSNSAYQAETSLFIPPSKQLMFNPSLTKSDGLLIQQVSVAESISFEKAAEEVESSVKFWKNHLNINSILNLQGLGSLKKGNDGLLNFEANHPNFLLESFGLEKFNSKYILQTEERKGSSTVIWKTAALVPILIGGFLYFGKPQPVTDFVNRQWSGFVSPIMNPNLKAVKAAESPARTVSENTYSFIEKKEAEKIIHDHQVIAGSFKRTDEADSFVESLRQKGYSDAQITQKRGSFNYVALQTFSTREEAQEYVNSMKGEMPKIWIFSVKN
ncbi:MAG: SPOR domain-containing protein [Weeksellaceae bacterium]